MMKLDFYKYRLPFCKPFVTATATYHHREGLILVGKNGGIQAVGESAPLPDFSVETLEDLITLIRSNPQQISELINQLIAADEEEPPWVASLDDSLPPSLAFGIDTLVANWRSGQQQKTVHQLLFGDDAQRQLSVNATLPMGELEPSLKQAQEWHQQGYQTLKIKVGHDIGLAVELVTELRRRSEDLRIRLDANKSWNLIEAHRKLEQFAGLGIEYCEEPLSLATPEAFRQLKKETEISLALDESLANKSDILPWISPKAADVLILKPMVVGSFAAIANRCRQARQQGLETVFTTSLESGIGRRMTASLATGLGSLQMAHGLATGQLLAEDLLNDSSCISNGYYQLPEGAKPENKFNPHTKNSLLTPLDI